MNYWRFWSGQKQRLALTMLGVAVMGIGLSIVTLLTDSIRGTVSRTYEQTWRAPYDILVHTPLPGTTDLPDIADPNILTALPPGISMEQVETIRNLPEVAVAAPLATVGFVDAGITVLMPSPTLPSPGPGVYRITAEVTSSRGQVPESYSSDLLVAIPEPGSSDIPSWTPAGAVFLGGPVTGAAVRPPLPILVTGVDPAAEAKMVGLDRAMVSGTYLDPLVTLSYHSVANDYGDRTEVVTFPTLPVLLSQESFAGMRVRVVVDQLDEQLKPRKVKELVWDDSEITSLLFKGTTECLQSSGSGWTSDV